MTKARTKAKRTADAVQKADAHVAYAAAPYRGKAAVELLSKFSELGDQPQMIALSSIVLAAGLIGLAADKHDVGARLTRAGARMLTAHFLATQAKNFVKHRVDRTRPRAMLAGKGGSRMKKGHNTAKEETSFPSGHSAGAIAVARAFAREFPEHEGKALAAAGVIALAQIPRCAHYPSDVGAGLAIGFAAEILVDRATQALPSPLMLD